MMKHVKCFSLKYLVRYVLVAGVLSTIAGAQQTLQLSPYPGTNCTTSGSPILTCQWANSSGCVMKQLDTPNPAAPAKCPSNASIEYFISDDGTFQTWEIDTCVSQITVDDGCTIVTSPGDLFTHTFQYISDGGGGGGGTCVVGGHFVPDCPSPIIVDTKREGFHLTPASGGVRFDIRADGHPIQIAWTAAGFSNGFLALDRNHNGIIDDGTELFGNFTQQPKSSTPNGFLALAEFDKPENGGNGDGIIDEHDAVFSHLVIWIDENRDGISQPAELHTLPEMGIYSLTFQYKQSMRLDEFGNLFRYKANVNPGVNGGDSDPGRWAVDVFLTTTPK